ncbi:MAG: 30S ribosomal protein S2 [Candidatus Marinimicrobia bacterium]|jgi:small subunit ribosomal protein S2|nr:30S ribosomal protein S2 [Candidatus Neomarinimicrobiota bacterium]MDP7465309.1 30S ribosomal protein S2 [Candidatus Neomarinimicrobiota bacterium]
MANQVHEKSSNSRKDKDNKKGFMNQLTVEELIKAGAHFGHPTHRWDPNYKGYITMKKNGVYIIDMEQTSQCMVKAAKEITRIVREGGNVLFVGTKKQAKDAVQQAADRCSMYYIVERWLGGTLTNYGTIKKSIKRLLVLEKESSEIYTNLTKKELSMLERERIKLADLHRGIKDMKHLPKALFFVDGIQERIAISEAINLGIPTFGIVDSNTDPRNIDFPIPANDDSMKTIGLIVNYIANVIIEATGGTAQIDEEITEESPTEENAEPESEVVEESGQVEEKVIEEVQEENQE